MVQRSLKKFGFVSDVSILRSVFVRLKSFFIEKIVIFRLEKFPYQEKRFFYLWKRLVFVQNVIYVHIHAFKGAVILITSQYILFDFAKCYTKAFVLS